MGSVKSYSTNSSDKLSTAELTRIVDMLKNHCHRDSIKTMYYQIWKQLNYFILRLDRRPGSWEKCIVLFIGHLINNNRQSATIKSYLSAIRAVLKIDGVKLNEDLFLITSLTKACKLTNDRIHMRRPIDKDMLALIVNQTKMHFEGRSSNQQPFLSLLYRTLFTVAYFGLFRVGELTQGSHPVLAKDVHISFNKKKLLFILHSSKTQKK